MDNQFLDHGNIASLRYLFRSFSREGLTTMKQLKLSEQDIPRFPPFSTLSVFTSVEVLDMHKCELAAFPGALITKSLPTLQTVDLSCNKLKDVEGILPLGQLKYLRDLRLEGNPMPYIELRTVLLQKLLYPEKLVHLKMVRIYTGMYRHPDFIVQQPNELRKSMSLNMLLAKKRKPAVVPRGGTFPMLEMLNGGRITLEELERARPYPEADIYCSPQNPKLPTPISRPLPVHQSLSQKKSHHPCLIRHPRVSATARWLKVEPLVINANNYQIGREKVAVTRTDCSYEASFLREDDSKIASESEGEEWTQEEKWVSDPSLLRGKTFTATKDPFTPAINNPTSFLRFSTMASAASPKSDKAVNVSRVTTLPTQRDLSRIG